MVRSQSTVDVKGAAEARRQARMDSLCIYSCVEDCAGQLRNAMGGKSGHTWTRKQRHLTNIRIFRLGQSDALKPRPGREAQGYHRRAEGLYFRGRQIQGGADGVHGDWLATSAAIAITTSMTCTAISGALRV